MLADYKDDLDGQAPRHVPRSAELVPWPGLVGLLEMATLMRMRAAIARSPAISL